MSSNSIPRHHIKHKVLVIGPSGCGKTTLIESILSRSKSCYECHNSSSKCPIKQSTYSQMVPFREIDVSLKIFERTVDGILEKCTLQPYLRQLDTIIGVYDVSNYKESFNKMRLALDCIIALYDQHCNNKPTIYVLGNIRDQRQCKSKCPFRDVKEYVNNINAIQLFNYCYSSRHIKAFHYVLMLNVYRRHFRQQFDYEGLKKAIENCRKHVYFLLDEQDQQDNQHSNLKYIRALFKRFRFPNHHHHQQNRHQHNQHNHHNNNPNKHMGILKEAA